MKINKRGEGGWKQNIVGVIFENFNKLGGLLFGTREYMNRFEKKNNIKQQWIRMSLRFSSSTVILLEVIHEL